MKTLYITLFSFMILSITKAQTVTLHPEFDQSYTTIEMDTDNDVIWLGTGFFNNGDLTLRQADGTKVEGAAIAPDVDFQSVSSMYMSESTLYVGGYGAVAIIDYDAGESQFFTNDNSDLFYNNEIRSILYDYNSEKIYAGNPATDTDVYDNEAWSTDSGLKRITASAWAEENEIAILAGSDGKLYYFHDGELTNTMSTTDLGIPQLPIHKLEVYEDDNDNLTLLISTYQQGIAIVAEGEAQYFTGDNSGLFGGDINGVAFDNFGTAWFTHIGGITSYDGTQFKTYPLESFIDVFADVEDIVVDSENTLWLASSAGLIEFSLGTTSVNNVKHTNKSIAPNPTNGEFTYQSDTEGTIYLYNSMGRMVRKQNLIPGKNHLQLEGQSGQYFFKTINSNNSVESGRFLLVNE